MLYAIIAVLVVLADQMIKLYVSAEGFKPLHLIPGILNLGVFSEAGEPVAPFHANTGGAFGLLGGQVPTYWFIIIAGVFTVLVVIALATKFIRGFLARWSIVLVTAGGVSNCIDRVINSLPEGEGHVVDMFQFDFWKSFPVFNLADIFICVFCIIFIFAILFGRTPKNEGYEDEFVEDEEEAPEEDEEEEEEERPARRGRRSRKAREEDEEDEEEVPVKPARGRKARQSKYDEEKYNEEYEQYKAAQRAREEAERAAEQPQPAAVVDNPSYDEADPFAGWERANAEKKAQAAPAEEKPTLIVSRKAQRSELNPDPQYASAQPEERPAAPAPRPQPVEPEAPARRPARRPAPAPVEEEPESFSLDDILNEFK